MTDLSTKTALFWDYGMFLPFAERLARDYARVLYFTPWLSAFPRTMDAAPGEGVPGIERVDNFFSALEVADVVVFPDCYDADLQVYLREQGVRVWGSANAEWLELQRTESHDALKKRGVAVAKSKEIVGLSALRRWADKNEDKWIKRSTFRGDFETFHHETSFITQSWIDVLQKTYGPQSEQITFIVEDSVEGIEVGWDCHSVDGKYPKLGMLGLEVKDKALVGVLKEFATLPEPLRDVYNKTSPLLTEGQFRNYMTLEVRLSEGGKAALLDPCMRFGSPASEAWMEMVGNVSQIVWEGAGGNLIEVDPVAKYAALAVIDSQWAIHNWTAVDFPKSIAQWIKMKNRTVIDGRTYFIPGHHEMQEIGVLVAVGNTLEEAIGLCEERAKEVSGYKVKVMVDSLRESADMIKSASEVGISFD